MTLIGKIFTVLIFIMSLVFMSFAVAVVAAHKNWKETVLRPETETSDAKPLGLKYQIEQAEQRNEALRRELNQLEELLARERAERARAIAALETRKTELEQEAKTAIDNYKTLLATHGTTTQQLQSQTTFHVKLTGEVEELRNEIKREQADRDQQLAVALRLTDEINRAKGDLELLTERRDQLAKQNAQQKLVMNHFGIKPETPLDDRPPSVDGVVLAVNGQASLIEISVGSDDGIREGHALEVYRDRTYLGRIVVRRTAPDRAVGEVLEDYRRGPIKKGDRVATKVS